MWISKNCFQTGTEYGSGFRNAAIDISRIQTFGKSCTLHYHSFIIFIQKHIFSLLYHDSESVCGVISAMQSQIPLFPNSPFNVQLFPKVWILIPNSPFNVLIGRAKYVSMNMFLVWQDSAVSIAYTSVVETLAHVPHADSFCVARVRLLYAVFSTKSKADCISHTALASHTSLKCR